MTNEQRFSDEFECLSEKVVKYLFRGVPAKIKKTPSHKDGGYDIVVECQTGKGIQKAYFECKLRNKNMNLRDIAANVIIAFNHGAVSLVAVTNHNFTRQAGDELKAFYDRTILNIKIITGERLRELVQRSGSTVSFELRSLLSAKKTRKNGDYDFLQINFDSDISAQLFAEKEPPLNTDEAFFCDMFRGEVENLIGWFRAGYMTVVSGYWGVGKAKLIQSALSRSGKRAIKIDALLHTTRDPLILEILSKIWGIPELELFSSFTKNEVKNITREIAGKQNDTETVRILTALFNERYADKRATTTQNHLFGLYISNLLALHKDNVGFVVYIDNLQFASEEIYTFLADFVKQLHSKKIGCVLRYVEPEYQEDMSRDFPGELRRFVQYREFHLQPLEHEQAVLYVQSIYPKLSHRIASLIVEQAGTRVQSLSSLITYIVQESGVPLDDARRLAQKLQGLTANDIPSLFDMLLRHYQSKYPDVFYISSLLDCRVSIEVYTLFGIPSTALDALVAVGIFHCDQGLLTAQNGFVRKWIQRIGNPVGAISRRACADRLLPMLEQADKPYIIEKISLYHALHKDEQALALLETNLRMLTRDKQYTELGRGVALAIDMAKALKDVEQEAMYLIEALELMMIQKELLTDLAKKRLDRLESCLAQKSDLPQYMRNALAFFKIKRSFKEGNFTHEDSVVWTGEAYYQACVELRNTDNTGDWLGRICSCYALIVKSTQGNEAALAVFEAACKALPQSFDLRREYLSHIACMELFDEPLRAFRHYQEILELFEREAPDSAELPFHEYGDLAMSQLIAGNLGKADELADSAIRISQSNGLLDEEGRNINIRGCIELCSNEISAAKLSFHEATAIMRYAGCRIYAWRSELNYIQLCVKNGENTPNLRQLLERLFEDFKDLLKGKITKLAQATPQEFLSTREYHALLAFGMCWTKLSSIEEACSKMLNEFSLGVHSEIYCIHLQKYLRGESNFIKSPYLKNGYIYLVG